eukprot:Lithocolla_globosa_v1_NODE_362_length_4309_cov_16.610576.p4 type:complete len:126 gc:universal NODE_362_length_4309_cov_16.610576:2134-2511(+)
MTQDIDTADRIEELDQMCHKRPHASRQHLQNMARKIQWKGLCPRTARPCSRRYHHPHPSSSNLVVFSRDHMIYKGKIAKQPRFFLAISPIRLAIFLPLKKSQSNNVILLVQLNRMSSETSIEGTR